MSYLRGPMTRDQIAEVMADERAATTAADAVTAAGGTLPAPPTHPRWPARQRLGDHETLVMPEVADGTPVRWVDVAAPWLAAAGGDSRGTRLQAAVVARVAVRYDDAKADLVHDTEYECIITPLGDTVDVTALDRSTTTTATSASTRPTDPCTCWSTPRSTPRRSSDRSRAGCATTCSGA
jgi:hypothetical protein